MRTTIDLPDELYRTLKARAALSGMTLRDLVQRLVEQGLRQPAAPSRGPSHRDPPPVIVAPRGQVIGALTADEARRIEEDEDEARTRAADGWHGRRTRPAS